MASHDGNIGLADSPMTQDFIHAVLTRRLHNRKFQSSCQGTKNIRNSACAESTCTRTIQVLLSTCVGLTKHIDIQFFHDSQNDTQRLQKTIDSNAE